MHVTKQVRSVPAKLFSYPIMLVFFFLSGKEAGSARSASIVIDQRKMVLLLLL
jgi:hypothetical protein